MTMIAKKNAVVTLHWSRVPGRFVNKLTGQPVSSKTALTIIPRFVGTVREWYETLVETCIDCSNQALDRYDNKPENLYVGPDVLCVLECSVLYRPEVTEGPRRRKAPVGRLGGRFTVFLDRNLRNTVQLASASVQKRVVGEVKCLDMDGTV